MQQDIAQAIQTIILFGIQMVKTHLIHQVVHLLMEFLELNHQLDLLTGEGYYYQT